MSFSMITPYSEEEIARQMLWNKLRLTRCTLGYPGLGHTEVTVNYAVGRGWPSMSIRMFVIPYDRRDFPKC